MTMTPTNQRAVELAPCPWCGDELAGVSVSEGSTFRWRKVDGCCADGPEVRHDTMADDQAAAEVDSRARAIAAWNRRTPGWRPISEDLGWPEGVAFVAEVMPDWTSMQLRDGSCYAFNRATGRVYKLPHPECPFVIIQNRQPLPPPPGE
jgi:hypothetical protein